MSKTSQKKRKKTTGWGRKLASTFIRKGTYRRIKIVGNHSSLDQVFVGYTHSGLLSVQVLSAVPGSEWKEVHNSQHVVIQRGGAK